jgi:hypothetical protein
LVHVPSHGTVPLGHTHWLFWQVFPPVQGLLQLPQWLLLVRVSAQAPLQHFSPGLQQTPWQQVAFQAQHVPSHGTVPLGHTHWLFWQVFSPVQGLLQLPQWLLLVRVSAQAPLQHFSPLAHTSPQSPQLVVVPSVMQPYSPTT